MILIEREIESQKIDLALKSDFNLVDAFRIFDLKQLGCITTQDFVEGLRANLDFIDFSSDDVYLFFKRVDKQGVGNLSFD